MGWFNKGRDDAAQNKGGQPPKDATSRDKYLAGQKHQQQQQNNKK